MQIIALIILMSSLLRSKKYNSLIKTIWLLYICDNFKENLHCFENILIKIKTYFCKTRKR
jgi:hypothetical protein